ncbi:MAG: nuclease-related domain-containing protein, partial [Kiritimatiellae bacterium]|nr:nuclease-related domain-containing protein [Kiritimatiellia bacterium]
MAFLDTVKEIITNKPAHLRSPYFAKADSDLKTQLEILTEFLTRAPESIKPQVEQDIRYLEAGRIGEENVAFELKNSFMPIIVLHDLNLEYDGLKAQIDFMVITAKVVLIIECKNLYGDIEVNSNGDFIRTTTFSGKTKREGIYSPITQNTRHMEVIKAVRRARLSNFVFRAIFDRTFNDNYKSVVVLANPKTVLKLKYAKKEVRDQIIRCDQLVAYIKTLYAE